MKKKIKKIDIHDSPWQKKHITISTRPSLSVRVCVYDTYTGTVVECSRNYLFEFQLLRGSCPDFLVTVFSRTREKNQTFVSTCRDGYSRVRSVVFLGRTMRPFRLVLQYFIFRPVHRRRSPLRPERRTIARPQRSETTPLFGGTGLKKIQRPSSIRDPAPSLESEKSFRDAEQINKLLSIVQCLRDFGRDTPNKRHKSLRRRQVGRV